MSQAELTKMGGEMVAGTMYLNRVEVGHMKGGNFYLTDAGRDVLKRSKGAKFAERKAQAEDVEVREPKAAKKAPAKSAAEDDLDLSDLADV